MHKKTIIFDFDGTIANTLDTVVKIYNQLAHKYHCKRIKKEDRIKLQSKKPVELMKEYGITHYKLPILLFLGRKELHNQINNIKPITGISKALRSIKKAGYPMGIMTSNTKENVNMFLEKNNLTNIFNFIYSGKNIFGKAKVINKLLKKHNISKKSAAYIGDETRDIEAAKKVGIPIISVSWGFNTNGMLKSLKPNKLIDEPKKLLLTLCKIQ